MKTLFEELQDAYAELSLLEDAASPSNPSFGDYSDAEWHDKYMYLKGKIYAIEESLAAQSPF